MCRACANFQRELQLADNIDEVQLHQVELKNVVTVVGVHTEYYVTLCSVIY